MIWFMKKLSRNLIKKLVDKENSMNKNTVLVGTEVVKLVKK